MTLARELIAHIASNGPLTVAEYIARCNAHYYATRDPLGMQGDFTTAPEISQIFGELVGAWVADQWQKTGAPQALLCEAGPGRGTLMKDALRATWHVKGFHDAVAIRLIETSPQLRAKQQETLLNAHPLIHWAETFDELPPLPLFFIANEFFDALPTEQYVREKLELTQRRVDHDGTNFVFKPPGEVVRETSDVSCVIMRKLAAHIHRHGGAALIVDYGYDGVEQTDTLQAVKKHGYADPLQTPGEADLTTHVDFAALIQTARQSGAHAFGAVTQGTFLKRLGAELRATALCRQADPEQQKAILSGLERIAGPHEMGELFKVIAVTSSHDKPAGF